MMKIHKLPPWEVVNHFIRYEPETGLMYWKINVSRYMKAGKLLGYVDKAGYRKVKFLGTNYAQHRLAWFLHYKTDPKLMLIDHIDGNKSNNKITNLRLVNHSQNRVNTGIRSNNKTGVVGVSFCKKSNRYRARVDLNGERIYQKYFDSFQAASDARNAVASEVFGEYMPFDKN